jgi:hypothetical protein
MVTAVAVAVALEVKAAQVQAQMARLEVPPITTTHFQRPQILVQELVVLVALEAQHALADLVVQESALLSIGHRR